jgi:hypothetical protein
MSSQLLEFADFAREQVEYADRDPSSRAAALNAAHQAISCIETDLRRKDADRLAQFLLVKPDINSLTTIDGTKFTEGARQVLLELEAIRIIVGSVE